MIAVGVVGRAMTSARALHKLFSIAKALEMGVLRGVIRT
jgi:hypothetical protein